MATVNRHNRVNAVAEAESAEPTSLQKANDCIAAVRHFRWPRQLFDEFWREGELALLFGPPGVGKSLFAVQLAETLARGRVMGTFRMPGYRRRTLYVDLVMSPAKFRLRYSYFPAGGTGEARVYRFSENLFRQRPAAAKAIGAWLRRKIQRDKIEVVIIDDLAALRQTDDGTAESLRVMRGLKEIVDETGVSMLVLASSCVPARGGLVDESDLRRTRAVCNVVDSVFAIGHHPQSPGNRYIIQTRSRNSTAVWTAANAPVCGIGRTDEMLLSFVFDQRFAAQLDPEVQRTICEIKALKDGGSSYRQIARALRISVSGAIRLHKKWTPDMGRENGEGGMQNSEFRVEDEDPESDGGPESVSGPHVSEGSTAAAQTYELTRDDPAAAQASDESEEYDEFEDEYLRDVGLDEPEPLGNVGLEMEVSEPPAAGPRRRSVYDLEIAINAYGREIYVEEWDAPSGRPRVWYEFDRQGVLMKSIRKPSGISTTNLGKTHLL